MRRFLQLSNKVVAYLRSNPLLVLLLLIVIVSRSILLYESIIPFSFDHGKDSLAVMHMLATYSPPLIGPWTSIPGLYFGPGWYYLLTPAFLLGGYAPVSGAVMMVALLLVQVVLAYRFWGFWAAAMISCAGLWFMFSTSAWNPFPMPAVTLGIVLLLQHSVRIKKVGWRTAFGLGLLTGLGFHFSSAYAIFYPLAIIFFVLMQRVRITLPAILAAAVGIGVAFLPQLVFELRHDFVQSKAIFAYFTEGGSGQVLTLEKVLDVSRVTVGELRNAVMPEMRGLPEFLTTWMRVAFFVIFLGVAVRTKVWKQKQFMQGLLLAVLLIAIPLVGYFFLHFNVWYLYGMMPVAVFVMSQLIEKSPRLVRLVFGALLLATPAFFIYDFYSVGRAELLEHRSFLPVKERTLAVIRDKAEGRPFSSYHYVPDIYDFSYQYLYFQQAFAGQPLPVEFSYQPGVPEYVTQKVELLQLFEQSTAEPEVVFFVVEEPERPEYLSQWWDNQQFSEIIEEIPMSEQVTLYVAEP